jgi:hypothetical protein
MQLQSTLACQQCGHKSVDTMPTDACQFFYDCKRCGTGLKPKQRDCCVFCSSGPSRARRFKSTGRVPAVESCRSAERRNKNGRTVSAHPPELGSFWGAQNLNLLAT